MFLNKTREAFFVSRTQNLCPQQMLRARANGETFVSATMCPRLPGPLHLVYVFNICAAIYLSKLLDRWLADPLSAFQNACDTIFRSI